MDKSAPGFGEGNRHLPNGSKDNFLTCLDYANFLTVIILECSTRSWGIRCEFVSRWGLDGFRCNES